MERRQRPLVQAKLFGAACAEGCRRFGGSAIIEVIS